jgi:IclR family pca regulon transcriptional regulator
MNAIKEGQTSSGGFISGYRPTVREQEMYHLRTVEGLTLPEIGERYGIGRQRVRQILEDAFGLTGTARVVSSGPQCDGVRSRIASTADARYSRSLEYGVAILECFTADRVLLRISELAEMVGISRATTHRYARTLVGLGYLEQDDKRRYRLTHRAARPGMAVVNTIRLDSPARTILDDLRAETGYTVSMGLLDGVRAIYIHRLLGHGPGQYEADGHLRVGAHVPVHCTAVGKALLSTLLDSELRSLLSDMGLDRDWSDAIEAEALVAGEIERVRKDGIAVEEDIYGDGAMSFAAPVTRWLGKPILAVEITAPAGAYTMEELLVRLGTPLKHAARLISV